jgi:hypothetical protein
MAGRSREQLPILHIRKLADKSEGEREPRYLARNVLVSIDDVKATVDEAADGTKIVSLPTVLVHPGSVERILFNPATPELEHEAWPLAGIELGDGDNPPPKRTSISTGKVAEGIAEGWIEAEGTTEIYRHGGPKDNPTAVIHGFLHHDALVFHTVNGDYRYRVTGQPDKYNAGGTPGHHAGDEDAEVRWYYELELDS